MKKRLVLVLGAAMIIGATTACGSKSAEQADSAAVAVESTETAESAQAAEVKTYEFETFDGLKVIINEGNLVSQETCEEPLEWEGLPKDAEQLAPGRDCILFADASNYYVEDATNKLVIVAVKEEAGDVIEESSINPPVLAAQEQYASIISQLQPGQAYGFADICTEYDVLLVSEDGAYEYGDGIMASINAKAYGLDADGNVIDLGTYGGGHTAYPLAVYDGCLMSCNNSRTMMEYLEYNDGLVSMITKKCVEVSYDEAGKASYSYMDADTQTDGTTDDDSMMQEMYDMYSNATVINFTVVE